MLATILPKLCRTILVRAAGFIAIVMVIAATSDAAEPVELKVMSFNVRYSHAGSSEDKTENNWNDPTHPRRERAIRTITAYNPDLLGVQETYNHQIKDLQTALADHDFYGIGRDDGKEAGEYSGIFFRKDRLERVSDGSFWLSEMPEKPGTTFRRQRGSVPRIASWVKLRDKSTGREFLVLNMHWDNASEDARRKSAMLVRSRLAALADGLPTIVMGDFNAREDSPAVEGLMGAEADGGPRLVDSFRTVNPERKPDERTHHDWRGGTNGSRIDYILSTSELEPTAAAIDHTSFDGRYPSDHYPVTATLRWQQPQ